jgi:hypothetical protein
MAMLQKANQYCCPKGNELKSLNIDVLFYNPCTLIISALSKYAIKTADFWFLNSVVLKI